MRSNSKLNKLAKLALVDMLASFAAVGGEVYAFPEYGVTVAIRPAGNDNGYFASVSVADGAAEKKFRRNVGEFLALDRAMNQEGVFLSEAGRDAASVAEELARVVGNYALWGGNSDREGINHDFYTGDQQFAFQPEVWREMKDEEPDYSLD